MDWQVSDTPVDYLEAVAWMEARAAAIAAGTAPECVWLLEHPALYTAGSSARSQDLIDAQGLPVIATRRGGQYTYHGPGQRVAYVLLNLAARDRDVRAHVARLEAWVIATLAEFQLRGQRRPGRVGVWIDRGDHDDKIAAIGVRVKSWVTLHGVALNVDPDLGHYAGIVPCGITGHGVTSLVALGLPVTLGDVDLALRRQFDAIFAIS